MLLEIPSPQFPVCVFLSGIVQFVLSEEYVCIYPSRINTLLLPPYTSYICCAVESLLIFGMSSNDVAISPESLSTCITKTGKIYHLHHCFYLLLICTSEETTAPLSDR